MLDFLLALWLLTPLPVPERAPPTALASLLSVAAALDLAGPTEGWGVAPFGSDFRWTRQALWRLADHPLSHDALRFPPTFECDHALAANYAFRTYVEARLAFNGRWGEGDEVLAECCRLAAAWSAARQAQGPGSVAARREGLKQLRQVLGAEAYYAGRMPPPIPVWRLTWLD